MNGTILVIDDDQNVRESLRAYLSRKGYEVHEAAHAEEAREKLDELLPDLALVDLRLPGRNGLELVREASRAHAPTTFIMISAYGDIQKAVKATQLGARDFIEKPIDEDQLDAVVEEALGESEVRDSLRELHADGLWMQVADQHLVGISDAMKRIYRQIELAGKNDRAPVLICGESGTGKELVARAVFENSADDDAAFVDVNCAALSESLLEAELFGHEEGAFTGARERSEGLFEAADGGAIFLDEIAEMPPRIQSKFLRVLEEGTFKRVGGTENIEVDCRVLASTNRDLKKMVAQEEFRRDLFYRLNVFRIDIPPLRERQEDIVPLAYYMLNRFSDTYEKPLSDFSSEAVQRLESYHWPGNAREMRNVVERAVIMGSGQTVKAENLFFYDCSGEPTSGSDEQLRPQSIESMEKKLIRKVLEENNWQKTKSARILGINRTTLWHKIKEYGLEEPEQQAARA